MVDPFFLLALAAAASSPTLYGLTRVANSASCSGAASGCSQLVAVNPATGGLTPIGAGHLALAALGDLVAIDRGTRTYYYLGGGWNTSGTFLVGLSLDTGAERCNLEVAAIGEYGIVGGGQSLSLDTAGNRLVITGLASADGPHFVLTAALGGSVTGSGTRGSGTCGLGPFEKLGTFPYSGSVPVAHSSELDAAGTTLYTNIATGAGRLDSRAGGGWGAGGRGGGWGDGILLTEHPFWYRWNAPRPRVLLVLRTPWVCKAARVLVDRCFVGC